MASCDDDFGLLGDETQSSQVHQQQQQQQQQQHHPHQVQQQQPPQQLAVSFSHRYIGAASKGVGGRGMSVHPRSLSALNTIATSPKKIGGVEEAYSEAFAAQCDVNVNSHHHHHHHHCFAAEDDPGFAPQSQEEEEEEEDDGDNGDCRSRGDAAEAAAAAHHPPPPSRRRDRGEELSDGEAPSSIYYTKKSRPTPSSSGSGDYRKDREEWSDSAIACLLDAYTEKYVQLNRGNLRGRDWEDVATTVSEPAISTSLARVWSSARTRWTISRSATR